MGDSLLVRLLDAVTLGQKPEMPLGEFFQVILFPEFRCPEDVRQYIRKEWRDIANEDWHHSHPTPKLEPRDIRLHLNSHEVVVKVELRRDIPHQMNQAAAQLVALQEQHGIPNIG